ncbi:CDP-glycerol glycerophosphotransferase family protein [Bacillus stercoris]|nr:CDP-glycerol glycerophosphotransferase family protein [Bacillus stercoris]
MSDLLISDYSSVPFEFALLDKPILFYTYDMEAYNRTRGLIHHYTEIIPGVPCRDSGMILTSWKIWTSFNLQWSAFHVNGTCTREGMPVSSF